ncbi:hypothetical protein BDV10DRAFT_81840 [Aspergillus recurvatus]
MIFFLLPTQSLTANSHTHSCCFFLLCLSKALLRRSQRASPALCLGTAPTRVSELFKTLITHRLLRTPSTIQLASFSGQSKAKTKQVAFSASSTIISHLSSTVKDLTTSPTRQPTQNNHHVFSILLQVRLRLHPPGRRRRLLRQARHILHGRAPANPCTIRLQLPAAWRLDMTIPSFQEWQRQLYPRECRRDQGACWIIGIGVVRASKIPSILACSPARS